MIKVLLADDHSIVRAGLRRIVEESGDIEVVAEASDGREAVLAVRKEKPDVAVIDISMPVLDGLEVITQLKSESPEVPILVFTMHEEHQYVIRAIETGAMGYITKQSAPEQLVKAIRRFIPVRFFNRRRRRGTGPSGGQREINPKAPWTPSLPASFRC
jgi:two-component system invasion response regulator UvrY